MTTATVLSLVAMLAIVIWAAMDPALDEEI
jgi:hypothetical protein